MVANVPSGQIQHSSALYTSAYVPCGQTTHWFGVGYSVGYGVGYGVGYSVGYGVGYGVGNGVGYGVGNGVG
jgi:hypothetical protein